MANETIKFEHLKKVVGGIRNDSAPTTADEDFVALRLNSSSELMVSMSGSSSTIVAIGSADQDAPVSDAPVQMAFESADFDGAAFPNDVDAEGDVVRPKASLYGVPYSMPVSEDGSASPLVAEATAAGVGFQISLDDGTDSVFAQSDTTGNMRIVGSVADDAVDSGDPVKIGAVARSALRTAVASGDRVNLSADVFGQLITAAHDITEASDRMIRRNPEWGQIEGYTIYDETNETDGTYYAYFSPESFGHFVLQYSLDGGGAHAGAGVTLTIEATAQDDGTAMSSCTYNDETNAAFGAASVVAGPSATASGSLIDNARFFSSFKYIRAKLVFDTAGGNTGDATIYLRQRY